MCFCTAWGNGNFWFCPGSWNNMSIGFYQGQYHCNRVHWISFRLEHKFWANNECKCMNVSVNHMSFVKKKKKMKAAPSAADIDQICCALRFGANRTTLFSSHFTLKCPSINKATNIVPWLSVIWRLECYEVQYPFSEFNDSHVIMGMRNNVRYCSSLSKNQCQSMVLHSVISVPAYVPISTWSYNFGNWQSVVHVQLVRFS